MQEAERDLRCYVTARQLHLATTLRQVFQRNSLSYPLFYSCLDPRARQLTVLILLSLQRWLSSGHREDETSADPSSPTSAALAMSRASGIFFLSRHILTYLSFPTLATLQAPLSPLVAEFHQLTQAQAQAQAQAADAASAAAAAAVDRPSEGHGTGEQASAETTPRLGAVASPPGDEGTPGVPGTEGRPSRLERSPTTPQRCGTDNATAASTPGGAAVEGTPNRPTMADMASGDASASHLAGPRPSTGSAVGAPAVPLGHAMVDALQIREPLFYCRPPLEPALTGDVAAGDAVYRFRRSSTYVLFVRMIHHSQLNEETLNPYFGRYGQTACTVLRRMPLMEAERFVPRECLLALSEAFQRQPEELLVQDFLIHTDSPTNAQRAVDHANYKELLFAALHDPALNTHALGDVDLIVMRCASLVLKKQSYGPPWNALLAANEEDGEGAEGGASAAAGGAIGERSRRHPHRKRHRPRKLTFADAPPGSGKRADSASSSSASRSDDDGTDDADSALDEEDESNTDANEADETGTDSELVFVPDVLVDGFPYWTTEDQLKLLFKEYGSVLSIQISTHDYSGAFTGCVLVRMETVEGAVRLCEEVHGRSYNGHKLVAGVLNEKLDLVSLTNAHEIRQTGTTDPDFLVTRNERLWA